MTAVLRRIHKLRNICHCACFGISTSTHSEKEVLIQGELHTPVMVSEVLECLQPQPGQVFIDMTFGAGGHSERILESAPDIRLFVLDRDPVSYSIAKRLAVKFPGQVEPLLGKFSELPVLLRSRGIRHNSIDGILFDFGCSSMQFDVAERGFSVSKNGPLDMRMDGDRFPEEPTAADVLAKVDEEDLVKILKMYGEEKQAKKIARAVIESRYMFKKLETTSELGDLVASVCVDEERLDKLQRHAHCATKTFQALRIFVNNELNELNFGMIIAETYLKVGGRLVTLTFHSLEDRIVKRHLLGNVIDNAINPLPLKYTNSSLWYDRNEVDSLLHSNWKLMHKHVLTPSVEEVTVNPRSRSAKLRAATKVTDPSV